jgi:dethiobiotin synthetase
MRKSVVGLFITGTDTDVGKTYVGALIAAELHAAGHRVGVYKPAASGCREVDGKLVSDDAVALWEAAGSPGELEHVCPQRFMAPLAPHLAARAEGRELDLELLTGGLDYWLSRSDVMVVEGAGGLLSPLGDELYVADVARECGFPLVIVARNAVGVINQTLQTLVAAATFRQGMAVAGIVLNSREAREDDPSLPGNRAEIQRRSLAPVLACVGHGEQNFGDHVDWFRVAGRSRISVRGVAS